MRNRVFCGGLCLAAAFVALAAGCRQRSASPPTPSRPVVPVSRPVAREVTEFVEYTGRTDAVQSVGVRARATGYLVRAPFREGDTVRGPATVFGARLWEGDLLFEIDPRPYQAQLEQAKSQIVVGEAQLKLAKANYARAKETFDKGAGSKQDVDTAEAAVGEAAARIDAAKASARLYELNLSFTRVRAPISGQVSRYYYTTGNLISQDQTLLTTIVSTDPMYAYFDLDERTLLRVRTTINQGKIPAQAKGAELPVEMGLEGETEFPHKGTVNFVNNVVNPSTGTIAVRGQFDNPQPPQGRRLLSPGMFVRIRLPIGPPQPALLVVDRALGSDQGQKFAYVVGPDNKIEYRKVRAGALQDDGLRVIEDGLRPADRVAVGAIQQLRPKMDVDPEDTAMPTPGAPAPESPPGAPPAPPKKQ